MIVVYDILTNKIKTGDINIIKHEILRYIQVKAEVLIEDTIMWLNVVLKNLKNDSVGYGDINMLTKLSESLTRAGDLIAGYLTLSKMSDYNEILSNASEYIAIENDISELLSDEIELLTNHEEYEKAELLKKCQKPVWVGFDRSDEYGSIICRVSE